MKLKQDGSFGVHFEKEAIDLENGKFTYYRRADGFTAQMAKEEEE